MKKYFISCFLLSLFLSTTKVNAWVYPEHREIMLIAIEKNRLLITETNWKCFGHWQE